MGHWIGRGHSGDIIVRWVSSTTMSHIIHHTAEHLYPFINLSLFPSPRSLAITSTLCPPPLQAGWWGSSENATSSFSGAQRGYPRAVFIPDLGLRDPVGAETRAQALGQTHLNLYLRATLTQLHLSDPSSKSPQQEPSPP